MLDATKPFLFGGGDNPAVTNETSGSIAMKSVEPEDEHGRDPLLMYAALAPHNNADGVWFIASCVVLVGDKKRIATRLSYKERFPKRLTQELFSLASTPKPPTN